MKLDSNRIYGLDILRSIAILFVVIEHGKYLLPVSEFPNKYFFALKMSLDGVSIFFVLSGFLIGGILIRNLESQEPSVSNLFSFWIKRWLRTLPNYLLVLLILILITKNISTELGTISIFNYFFFLQNFNYPHPGFFGEAWSLSVEEWFYLIIPSLTFLLVFLKFKAHNVILFSAIAILFISTLFRYHRFQNTQIFSQEDWDLLFRKQVITRLDSLMFGVVGAYAFFYHNGIWKKNVSVLLYLGIVIMVLGKTFDLLHIAPFGLYNCVFSFTVNSLGTLLLFPYLTTLKTGKGLLYKSVTYISLISYSMYLLNLSIVQYNILSHIEIPSFSKINLQLIKYFSYWFLTVILSSILYFFYERPIMNLRNKIPFLNNKNHSKL